MKKFSRRDFFKVAGGAVIGAATYGLTDNISHSFAQSPVIASTKINDNNYIGSKAKVYFSSQINTDSLLKLYNLINEGIYGKTAIKLHTGEKNGPNILPRDMVRVFQQHVPNSNIVETNTLYKGDRYTTESHRETLKINGWDFCPVDIMDENGTVMLPVRNGKHFQEISMGKNIAIGCADGRIGKSMVHGVSVDNQPADWGQWPSKERLMENMAESAKAVIDYFGKHIVFINVLRRMSIDCDCAGLSAAEPTIPDIGILASTDLLAIDQASIDLVYAQPNNQDLIERIESRHGLHQLTAMRNLKMGNPQYELISIN